MAIFSMLQTYRMFRCLLCFGAVSPVAAFACAMIFGGSIKAQDLTPEMQVIPYPTDGPIPGMDIGVAEPLIDGVEIPEAIDPDHLKTIDGFEGGFCTEEYCVPRSRRYTTYRHHEGLWGYLPGDGDQFGWIDFEDTPYLGRGEKSGWSVGMSLHLLSGPNAIALPPRLWDFSLGYQTRATISDLFSCDLAATIGVYSDFEDSARDGVRFPAHAVGILHANEAVDWVAGVDYLDRDDYRILPVAGFSWHSPSFPNWNVDMIFPRPRVDFALTSTERLYVGGLLGGGTWDIEMPGDVDDVMTYRDLRLIFGLEQLHAKGRLTGLELGYVFARRVELRAQATETEFDDGFLIRWVSRR
jgi:hypothetical protein